MPLHIFEPRYRRMLADCLAGDRRFGLIYKPDGTGERELPAGHVGCVAIVEEHEPLPDGRSNILVRGEERFALDRFDESTALYHVGRVEPFADDAESELVARLEADEVRALFRRVVQAARTLGQPELTVPELPDDPATLSFLVAAMVDIEPPARQRLLASRSSRERLAELRRLLGSVVETLEVRAAMESHRGRDERGWGDAPEARA
jgi:Lon protease-like protein